MSPPRVDIHVHLAGVGAGGSGCFVSPAFRKRWTFRLLQRLYGVEDDAAWAQLVASRVAASRWIDYAVLLGFDGVYDRGGRLDRRLSQMVVPPEWVFEACRRHRGVLPGPSLNPYRADAGERLAECVERGAVLVKWLPAVQRIDPSDPGCDGFYRVLAAAGVPLLVHTGGERTFRTVAPRLNDPRLLRRPLEHGVTVICAHSATRLLFTREPDHLPRLRELLDEFSNLWVDNSGLLNPGRYAHVPRLARDPLIHARTLHGSDFPVPPGALYFPRQLGLKRAVALQREPNPLDRDVEVKLALGYSKETLTRAASLLPRWSRAP
ncbi:MAG: amidohydrolase family protein [Longimicrobiaceae bacterium]